MLCRHPFVKDPSGRIFHVPPWRLEDSEKWDAVPFPCGQCLACRINKRRLWTHRLLLEAMDHDLAAFVTLTYSPDFYPEDGNLSKRTLQLWLKRLRFMHRPRKLRFYAVGEYGSQTHRAHYHAIVFGLDPSDDDLVRESWPYGHVMVAEVNRLTIQYVVGYVTKKRYKKDNDDGIEPEFALMSRRPGLGYSALKKLSELIQDPKYKHLFSGVGQIPDGLRHGRSFMPFDRFSRHKLAELTGVELDTMPFFEEMRKRYFTYKREHPEFAHPLVQGLIEESKQRNRQIDARFRMFSQRTKI